MLLQKVKKNKIKPIKTLEALLDQKIIPQDFSKEKISALKKVAEQFSISITPHIAHVLSSKDQETSEHLIDPLERQFIPDERELEIKAEELNDPVGDHSKSPVPGIVHRYPDRCLLKVSNMCPVYCRFCFRREQIGHHGKILSASALDTAFDYIQSKPEIWEVILTGGDPLMLTPKQLGGILRRLEAIKTVEVIRIHTRIPVVDPQRINSNMLKALKTPKALFIVLHANHASEFTEAASQAISSIIHAGIPMLSQSVLLKGINDEVEVLKTLLKTFVKHRIKPYYLHHCDLAKGTSHFRTSLSEGKKILRSLRGHISGLCQPTYILDIPGGYGKVPVDSHFVKEISSLEECASNEEETYEVEDFQGKKHRYPPSG